MCHRDHIIRNQWNTCLCLNVLNEGFIDFKDLDVQFMKSKERRITGPKVIQTDAYAVLDQICAFLIDQTEVVHQDAFGNLQLKLRRRDIKTLQSIHHALNKINL